VYSIGEFSRITGLSVKTLRFYHEEELLAPTSVDEQSGYRYYAPALAERARAIARLRDLEVSLADIREILGGEPDEADLVAFLERHRRAIEKKLHHYRGIGKALDQLISQEREARRIMNQSNFEVQEKTVGPLPSARCWSPASACAASTATAGRRLPAWARSLAFASAASR
jgi:DNA-binding transcriptional MerR regulator